jgi:HSP20 family protein
MAGRREPFAEIGWTAARPAGRFAPAVDIFEDDDAVLVKVEVPGVRPEEITIDTHHHVLTIHGERRFENAERADAYHRIERSYGVFSRSFALPESVDAENAVAVMADGVLTIRLPKRADARPALPAAS